MSHDVAQLLSLDHALTNKWLARLWITCSIVFVVFLIFDVILTNTRLGEWLGTLSLPTCFTRAMTWLGKLESVSKSHSD
jgi:hypothetical protein